MTIRITQIDNETTGGTTLQLEGRLLAADAGIVEQVFEELADRQTESIDIDLSKISFINSESAAVLKLLESRGAVLKGMDFFIRQVIESYRAEQRRGDRE